jgi:opacity protein-like surface antigen
MVTIVKHEILSVLCVAISTQAVAMPAACLSSPGKSSDGYWRYHLVDGKPCWYPGASKIIFRRIFKHYWTGPYLGANAGYGISSLNIDTPFIAINPPEYVSANGPLVGGQVGYRVRLNRFMFGVEDQLDYANVSAVDAESLSKITWTNSTDLIVGYTIEPRWLAFIGIGVAEGKEQTNDVTTGSIYNVQLLGADFEIGTHLALTDNVSTGVKFQVIDFGPHQVIESIKWTLDLTWIKIEGAP